MLLGSRHGRWGVGLLAVLVVGLWCVSASAVVLAVGDANVGSCEGFPRTEASPGFRSFLPDCRAYELVSPPYTAGNPIHGVFEQAPLVSADGDHVIAESFAGFAGTENLEEDHLEFGALYKFSRTSSGWNTEPLDPPASEDPRSNFTAASADFTKSLWRVVPGVVAREEVGHLGESAESSEMLVVREEAGGGKGRFVTVGPLTAPGREELLPPVPDENAGVVAESDNLGVVLLEVHARAKQTWPGDQTEAEDPSLYEYRVGDGSEPTLVGVSNQGALSGSPVNADAHLISKCGTRLGSQSTGTTYNALSTSASGERVYFTALACPSGPVANELYARVNGSETVDISEPSHEDCKECDTTEPQEAVFEGASQNGSKVFFVSSQQLLPGAVGQSLYEYDFNGEWGHRVVLIAPDVPGVARISEDGSRIYFESTDVLASGGEAEGYNLYVYDTQTGQTAFVATLMTHIEAEGRSTARIERTTHVKSEDQHRPFATTHDGEFLVFPSARKLTNDDTSSVQQLFEYYAATGRLSRVSIGAAGSYVCPETKALQDGYDCDGNTSSILSEPQMLQTPPYTGNEKPTNASSYISVAEDGAVAFTSPLPLTPLAVPGRPTAVQGGEIVGQTENVYEYRDGLVYLISPADESAPLITQLPELPLLGMGLSGEDVFFLSADALVPQVTGTQAGWYDARVGGGFPGPAVSPGCAAVSCRGPLTVPGSLLQPESAVSRGGGNLAPVAALRPVVSRQVFLARALRACRRKKHRKRCEALARRRYRTAGRASRRGK